MNTKQKVLTVVMLPVFLFVGLFIAVVSPENPHIGAFTGWFAVMVIYFALFFLLKPSKPN